MLPKLVIRVQGLGFRKKTNNSVPSTQYPVSRQKGFTTFSSHQRGFTLIEILVAMAILAIISTIGLMTYQDIQKNARDSKRKQDAVSIGNAVELYYTTNKAYPQAESTGLVSSNLSTLLSAGYINKLPEDPRCDTGTGENCYRYRKAAADERYIVFMKLEGNPPPEYSCASVSGVPGGYNYCFSP